MAEEPKKKSIRTTVTVPADDRVALDRIAEKKSVSIAWVIRDAIKRYLAAEARLSECPED